MKINKIYNAKRNIIWGMLNRFICMFFPFLIRSIIIKKIGADYLGLDSLFTSILQVLNLSELGFGSAVVYSMYKPIAEDDKETICSLLNFYKNIYRVIGIVVLVLGICIAPFLKHIVNGSYPNEINIYILYFIYLLNTTLSYGLFAYESSLLNAFQRVDIVSNVNSISRIFLYVFQILVLISIPNYYVYLIVLPLYTIINNLLIHYKVNKYFPNYKARGRVPLDVKKEIKKNVTGLMVSKLCIVSRNSLDSIFVSMYLGLTLTAVYNNYYYVINVVTTMLAIISSSMAAGIGNSVAVYSIRKNYNDMVKFNYVYMMLSSWTAIIILCLYQPFMKLWVGEKLMLPDGVMFLFVLYYYVIKMCDVKALYADAVGLWWQNRTRTILEAISNLLLNILLGRFFGVSGIILGTLIPMFIFSFFMSTSIVFECYFKEHFLEYIFKNIKYLFVTIVASIVTWSICNLVTWRGITGLGCRLFICIIISPIILWFLTKNSEEYRDTKSWISSRSR